MTRIALPLSFAAAALLGACGMMHTERKTAQTAPMDTVATQEIPYRAGAGVVQSVTPAPGSTAASGATGPRATPGTPTITTPKPSAPKPSAAAPGASSSASASAGAAGMYRLGIRMEDGKMQYVDMMGPDVPTAGTRVRLTPDKQIVREQ